MTYSHYMHSDLADKYLTCNSANSTIVCMIHELFFTTNEKRKILKKNYKSCQINANFFLHNNYKFAYGKNEKQAFSRSSILLFSLKNQLHYFLQIDDIHLIENDFI